MALSSGVPIDPPRVSRSAPPSSFRVSPCLEKQRDRRRSGRKVAGPIGGHVQRSPPAALQALTADHVSRRQLGSLDHKAPKSVHIPLWMARVKLTATGSPCGRVSLGAASPGASGDIADKCTSLPTPRSPQRKLARLDSETERAATA